MYYNIRVWHTVPLYPRLQVHVYGAVQNPPFKHKGLHTAKIESLITILYFTKNAESVYHIISTIAYNKPYVWSMIRIVFSILCSTLPDV